MSRWLEWIWKLEPKCWRRASLNLKKHGPSSKNVDLTGKHWFNQYFFLDGLASSSHRILLSWNSHLINDFKLRTNSTTNWYWIYHFQKTIDAHTQTVAFIMKESDCSYPDDFQKFGYKPVWTQASAYPGEILPDIQDLLYPGSKINNKMIGPISSIFSSLVSNSWTNLWIIPDTVLKTNNTIV